MFGKKKDKPVATATPAQPTTPAPQDPQAAAPAPQAAAKPQDTAKVLPAGLSSKKAAAFGDIMRVMMASPRHRKMPLGALHSVVVPALNTKQFLLARDDKNGGRPVGVAFYAHVSPEVHARIVKDPSELFKMKPEEWVSGDIDYVVDIIAPKEVGKGLMSRLFTTHFAGKKFHLRNKGEDGKATIMAKMGAPKANGKAA